MMLSKSEPLPEGTVIMADNQYAGRGQKQNIWHAEPGLNLTISILLRPSFLPVERQFTLNVAVSNGINKALHRRVAAGIRVKWPNDIYYYNQKIGGVLIENGIAGSTIKSCIVGIGLNVNQKTFDLAKVGSATSLSKILQEDVNLQHLLTEICQEIEGEYLQMKTGRRDALHAYYLANLYKFREPAYYRHNGEVFKATIVDVTLEGLLVLEADGKRSEYNFKEIEFLSDVPNKE